MDLYSVWGSFLHGTWKGAVEIAGDAGDERTKKGVTSLEGVSGCL